MATTTPRLNHPVEIKIVADTPEATAAVASLIRRLFALSTESVIMKNIKPPPGYRVYVNTVVPDLDVQEIVGDLGINLSGGSDDAAVKHRAPLVGPRVALAKPTSEGQN